MPMLDMCRGLSRLMSYCSLGRWTCQLVSEHDLGRYILRSCSGVPCLSGYGNDSTWEIIFKVCLKVFKKYEDVIQMRHLKEPAHMLGYFDLLSRPSIEINTIWEPIIEKSKSNFFKSKISRITDAIGFYVSNSSHGASCETSCNASRIDRHEKQWHHYLNKIFIFLECLVCPKVKL